MEKKFISIIKNPDYIPPEEEHPEEEYHPEDFDELDDTHWQLMQDMDVDNAYILGSTWVEEEPVDDWDKDWGEDWDDEDEEEWRNYWVKSYQWPSGSYSSTLLELLLSTLWKNGGLSSKRSKHLDQSKNKIQSY